MRLDNTYRAWPVTIVIFVAIGCLAAPEVARDAIRRQLVATESGIERFTRVIEDAFRLPPIQVEKENANDVPSMSRRRPPRVFRPPAHNVDVAPGLPSLEPEVAPDPVIAADVKPLGTEPDAGMSPWSESIVAVANITDASAEPFPGKGGDEVSSSTSAQAVDRANVADDFSADVTAVDADSDIASDP